MKVSAWMPVGDKAGGIRGSRHRDIDWPQFLGLPSPGDILNLAGSDGEIYSYDVKRVNYYPHQDEQLNFAVIELPVERVEGDWDEAMAHLKTEGWIE